MATTIYLRDSPSELGGAGQKLMSFVRGTSATNFITNTTASDTNIQVTDTAGGTAVAWFSPPLQAVTISASITVNICGSESVTSANAGAGILVERCDNTGNVLSTIVADTPVPATITEYTTTDAAKTDTFTPASTSLSAGDRIKVTLKVRNVGTMGGSATVTNTIGGATAAAAGDTYVTFTEALVAQTAAITYPALTDNFSSADSAKWDYVTQSAGAVSVTGGQLHITPTLSYPAISSKPAYNFDFTGKAVCFQFTSVTDLVNGVSYWNVKDSATNGRFELQLSQHFGGFIVAVWFDPTDTQHVLDSVALAGVSWCRIRELYGVVYYETSADGLTWNVLSTIGYSGFSISSALVDIGTGFWQADGADTYVDFIIDNFNLPPAPPITLLAFPWTASA